MRHAVHVTVLPIVLLAFLGAIGYADYVTGYEVSVGFFYLLPVVAAGWWIGRSAGIVFAILAGLTSLIADLNAGHVYSHQVVPFWNALNRSAISLVAALVASALAQTIQRQKDVITSLRRALLNSTDLRAQIPICSVCGQFRNDEVYQEGLLKFLLQQDDPHALGQVCHNCSQKRQTKFEVLADP